MSTLDWKILVCYKFIVVSKKLPPLASEYTSVFYPQYGVTSFQAASLISATICCQQIPEAVVIKITSTKNNKSHKLTESSQKVKQFSKTIKHFFLYSAKIPVQFVL